MFGPHDGRRVAVHPYRRMMTFLMRGRNESAVYFEHEIDLARTQPWLADRRAKLFPLLLHALAQTLHERERLNRFTLGHRVYQRTGVHLSFAAKKKMIDDAPLATVKREFARGETLDQVSAAFSGDVADARSDKKSHIDKELGILLALPAFLLRMLVWLNARLYKWGLAPRSIVDTDPMYASAFVANLGSIQLDAAYHHLYEHGNCPLFVTVGKVRGDKLTMRYTFDERVEDGHYCARSLELFKERVEDPASWLA
ncbi:MAG TPA: hypothetical protein VGC41_16310 [Kofleriaceae bacterium]